MCFNALRLAEQEEEKLITIVSGLPRSGTSMMMQALKNGGMEILSDNIRRADENNPKGYWEYEKVKTLPNENRWLLQADGKAVKIIAQLLRYIPLNARYKVIFMERNLDEILASQEKMLLRMGKSADGDSMLLKAAFTRQLRDIKAWLQKAPNIETFYLNYGETVKNPQPYMESVRAFLGADLDISAMAAGIDATLYREKRR